MYIKSAALITFLEPSQCGTVKFIGMPMTDTRLKSPANSLCTMHATFAKCHLHLGWVRRIVPIPCNSRRVHVEDIRSQVNLTPHMGTTASKRTKGTAAGHSNHCPPTTVIHSFPAPFSCTKIFARSLLVLPLQTLQHPPGIRGWIEGQVMG